MHMKLQRLYVVRTFPHLEVHKVWEDAGSNGAQVGVKDVYVSSNPHFAIITRLYRLAADRT